MRAAIMPGSLIHFLNSIRILRVGIRQLTSFENPYKIQ
jgi:hypothetical protein